MSSRMVNVPTPQRIKHALSRRYTRDSRSRPPYDDFSEEGSNPLCYPLTGMLSNGQGGDGLVMASKLLPTPLPETVTLSESGLTATINDDRFVPGSLLLTIGDTPQSHLNVGRPEVLQFEYIRRIGHVVDLTRQPAAPLTALHLGGGALTLPRYLEATRPGSRQQVIEWEPELIDLVRRHAPWDPSWSIRIRYGDARQMLDRLPAGLRDSCDVIVVDLFAGDHTPAHLTSTGFYESALRYLNPTGVLVVNVVDGPGQKFARSQWATLSALCGFVGVVGEASIVRGRRFGNLVTIATKTFSEPSWWPELSRLGPHPSATLSGTKLAHLISGHAPVTDQTATDSPQLGKGFTSES